MDSWTLWSEQQPTDAKLVYRWRIPAGTGHAAGVVGETLFSPMPT